MKLNLKLSKLKMLAICLLIIAGIVFYYEEIKENEVNISTIDVIVAVNDITENEVITKDMITKEKRYSGDVMKNNDIVKTESDVIGKRTIVPIFKGEPINSNRIIENKEYMNKKDQTQIALTLTEVDKALDLKVNDYIDIWVEPISQAQENQISMEPYKFIQKIQVIKVHDINFNNINNQKNTVIEDTISTTTDTVYVPSYITIELDDIALKELYIIDKSQYNIRITRYGEEKFYSVINDVFEEGF